MLNEPGLRCAVVGQPVAHSLSPALHRAAYAALGLQWRYTAVELTPQDLPGFVAGLDGSWRGLSVTMPLKEVAVGLGEPDDLARGVGVANTIVLGGDGPRVYNTDVTGFAAAIAAAGLAPASACLLGSGATARAAVLALGLIGCRRLTVASRSLDRTAGLLELAREVGLDAAWVPFVPGLLPRSDLLVSTVTAGAADGLAEAAAERSSAVFDVIYHPWPTALARVAAAAGRATLSGLDLLVHQGVGQLKLFTGAEVDPGVLMAAGLDELRARTRD